MDKKNQLANFFSQLASSFQKRKAFITVILLLSSLGINIYFRLYPAYFPQLKKQARINVENKLIGNITEYVNAEFPDYNPLIKEKIITETLKQQQKEPKGFQEKVTAEYKNLKDKFQDETGQTYLLGLDSYQWARYVENIVEKGHPGDRLVDGRPYDDHMLASKGSQVVYTQFFFYLPAYLYKTLSFFVSDINLERFLFYLPLFYTAIFLILIYFFTRYLFSNITAFFSVLFIGLNPSFFARTCAGWFDYDIFTLIFPLIIVWLLYLSVKTANHLPRLIFYSASAALFLGFYSYSWLGFWWIFIVVIGWFLYIVLNEYSINYKVSHKILIYLISGAVFFIFGVIACWLISGINLINVTISNIKGNLRLGLSQGVSIWPNIYYTVAELKKSNPQDIINSLYGIIIFIFSMIGLLWFYVKERRTERKYILSLLVFWAFFMFFASFKGVRFTIFLLIPLGIVFGAFLIDLFRMIKHRFRIDTRLGIILFIVLLSFTFWSGKKFIDSGRRAAISQFPLMNDNWHKALNYVRNNTISRSIINSWWDYGNFFKKIADRPVIFDGQSQNKPLAYYMANVITANDEQKAMNILRMLNNSSDTLYKEVNKSVKNHYVCISLFNQLFVSDADKAIKILSSYDIPDLEKEEIIQAIHTKDPAPAYFIVDKRIVHIMPQISFIGNWDFAKLYVMKNRGESKDKVVEEIKDIFNLKNKEAEQIYNEVIISSDEAEKNAVLSERFYLKSDIGEGGQERDIGGISTVYFDNGIVWNSKSLAARLFFPNGQYKQFKNISVFDGKEFSSKKFEDADLEIACLFFKDDDKWRSIVMSEELVKSLFVRLYFLEGAGLEHFEPFYSDDDAGIYVYEIRW